MNKVDLTFGIPVYNAEKYIEELLRCFDDTKEFSYEVVIVDDGSKDNSYNLCKNFKNSHFRVYHHENQGVSATRNFIIDNALGSWITFIDADDLIDFDKYKSLFLKVKSDDYDYHVGIRKRDYYNSKTSKITYLIEHELINSPVDKFYKVDILQQSNIKFDSNFSLGEDLLFNLNYYEKVSKVNYYYSDNMYMIRNVNSNSLTHRFRDNKFMELMAVNKECVSLFQDNVSILKSLEYIRVKNCISCVKDIYRFPGKIDNPKEYIRYMRKYKKKRFIFLNTCFTTRVYYFWYFVPNFLKLRLIKRKYGK